MQVFILMDFADLNMRHADVNITFFFFVPFLLFIVTPFDKIGTEYRYTYKKSTDEGSYVFCVRIISLHAYSHVRC